MAQTKWPKNCGINMEVILLFIVFYISEECAGNLYNSEQTYEMQLVRKKEICDFFREFKKYIKKFAPENLLCLQQTVWE